MAALIGALRVSLSADTAAFQSGMKRAEAQTKKSVSTINKTLSGIKTDFFKGFVGGIAGAFALDSFVRAGRAALEYAGSLGEVAQQLGVTTRDLQVLRYAAGQTGISQEKLEVGLSKLTITLGKVAAGAKAPIAALNAIGISATQLRGKDTGEAFRLIADGLQKVTDRSQRAAIEVAIFGKSGASLDTLLSGGSKAINELALAAEELGIVLSDEQIQKADQTADKIDALMTVLKAQIAGDIADNSDAIFEFTNALSELVGWLDRAREAFNNFQRNYNLPHLVFGKGEAFGPGVAGSSVTTGLNTGGSALAIARARGLKIAGSGGGGGSSIPQFLKSGGGGKPKKAPRDTSLRDAFQFEEEQRRAEIEILRAKQDLAHDYVERTALAVQILNLEKEGFEAELQFRIASKEITAAQAEKLRLKNDELDHLSRMAVLERQEEDRQRDYNALEDRDFDAKMDLLEKQADLAETASERRDVELRILDLAYEEERRRLERTIRESKDWAEIEAARRALLELSKRQSLDRAGVIQGTRGPMEDWLAGLPTTAAKTQEAFERLQVQGFEGLIDSALALSEGFGSAKDSLLDTLKQFLLGLARMQLQQGLASLIQGGGLKLPGFALGGNTMGVDRRRIAGFVHGEEGILNPRGLSALGVPNLNALNRGRPLSDLVSNDNRSSRGDTIVNVNGVSDFDSFRRNQRQVGRAAKRSLGIS